jgi:hypothetical protein
VTLEAGAEVACPYCGEPVWVAVDPGGGLRQSFISDCEVCCRPIRFRATVGEDGTVVLDARTEDDAT